MSATNTQDEKFNLFFQLTKVDEAQRLVYGRATQEVPDGVREIFDFDSSLPYFQKWSDAAMKRSGGKSRGNVREMHEPIAAGKVLEMNPVPAEKAIDIGTYCSDDGTWKKILDGTLTGFSVGGKYKKRWADPGNPTFMRYTAEPSEISYVDSPAVPTATYTLIKADGSQELRKAVSAAPLTAAPEVVETPPDEMSSGNGQIPAGDVLDDNLFHSPDSEPVIANALPQPAGVALPATPPLSEVMPVPANVAPLLATANEPVTPPASALIEKFIGMAETFADAVNKLDAIRKADAAEKEKIETKLKATGSRVGIARREGEPLTAPKDYPTDPNEYGDPANWGYPVDKPRVVAAVGRFNGGAGKGQYSPSEWNVLGRRIARLASRFGATYSYSPKDKQITNEVNKMEETVQKVDAGAVLAQLSAAMKTAADMIGKDPQAAQDLLMAALGSFDTSSAVSDTPPSLTGNAETIKAAGSAAVPTMTSSTDTETAPIAPTKAALPVITAPSTSTGSSSSSSPSSDASGASEPPTPVLKALQDQLAALSAQVATLTAAPAPVAKAVPATNPLPVNGLQAMIAAPAPKEGDDIIKALREGGPGAFQKALKAADGNEGKVYRVMNERLNTELVDMGINSQPYQVGAPQ